MLVTGAVSHSTADGRLPGLVGFLGLFVLAAALASLGRLQIVALVVAGQALVHVLLGALVGHHGDAGAAGGAWWQHQLDHLSAQGMPMVTAHLVAALAVGLWLAEGEAAVWDRVVLRLADVARAVVRRVALARALGEAVAVLRLAPLLRPAAFASLPGPGFFPCVRPVRGPPV